MLPTTPPRASGATINRAVASANEAWERTRPACSFRRPAENIVPIIWTHLLAEQNGETKFATRRRKPHVGGACSHLQPRRHRLGGRKEQRRKSKLRLVSQAQSRRVKPKKNIFKSDRRTLKPQATFRNSCSFVLIRVHLGCTVFKPQNPSIPQQFMRRPYAIPL